VERFRLTADDPFAGRDAVFFDAGFTLLEPARPVGDVYAAAARTLGVAVSEADMTSAVLAALKSNARRWATPDLSSSEALERAAWGDFTGAVALDIPGLSERHADWLDALVRWFDAPESWRPVDGALELIDDLLVRGKRVAIVSNWHGALHGIAARHGLTRRVSFILTSAEAGRRKPHPDIFRQALARLGTTPERTVHIGDSMTDDVEGALGAGLAAVHLSSEPPASAGGWMRVASLRRLIARAD
jgi:putative hydrolase of the HAD superfamily